MRDYILYLNEILSAIIKIEDYSKDSSYEKFQLDGMLQDAIIRNVEIIGEAVKKIPDVIKNDNKEIEWRKIAGRSFTLPTLSTFMGALQTVPVAFVLFAPSLLFLL